MIYYGFSETSKKCIFTSSGPVNDVPGVIVITSEEFYDINDICYGLDGSVPVILPRKATTEELSQQAANKKAMLLDLASKQVSILTDVVEFSIDPTAGYKLTEWREYRAKVYGIDTTVPENIEWPPQPEL